MQKSKFKMIQIEIKCDTFVKKRLSVLPTKNIQKQKKNSSITDRDKD